MNYQNIYIWQSFDNNVTVTLKQKRIHTDEGLHYIWELENRTNPYRTGSKEWKKYDELWWSLYKDMCNELKSNGWINNLDGTFIPPIKITITALQEDLNKIL